MECELRLLRTSICVEVACFGDCNDESPELSRAVELIEQGNYAQVLRMETMRSIFMELPGLSFDPNSVDVNIYDEVGRNARSYSCDDQVGQMLVLAAGVASLAIFLQANFTGPEVKFPAFPMWSDISSTVAVESWDTWARGELMVDGCDIIGKCLVPQYLLLAKALLGRVGEQYGPVTRVWWASRALMAQQRVLNERSPTLLAELKFGYSEVIRKFGASTSISFATGVAPAEQDMIPASAYLEAALMGYYYRLVDSARSYLDLAQSFSGLKYSVEGAMGYRRKFQVDPKVQLVLRDEADLDTMETNLEAPDETDVLLAPRLEDESGSFLHRKVLTTIQQAIVLARSLDLKRTSPADDIQSWKMAPFIEAVDAQKRSTYMVKAACGLYRVDWEKSRGPTRERAFQRMGTIVEDCQGGSTQVSERIRNVFCVSFPCIQELLRDYANMLVGFGGVGEALRLFEELELWHSLIDCHRMLGDKARATSLIKERVQISPNDPRLWCSLGHVTDDDNCLLKSWEVSKQRFAPAQRALARSAYNRKEYAAAIEHWELALALNSVYSEGWFSLGFAAMKAQDMDKALNAFSRTVQLDPENGEAWNNVAALNMQRRKFKEASIAFREALKFKRNSWQMWENYAHVCFELRNYSQTLMALTQVFKLSEKNFNLVLLPKLIEVVEKDKPVEEAAETKEEDHDLVSEKENLEYSQDTRLSNRAAENLTQQLGNLLSQVALSGNFGGEVWGLKARWHKLVGEESMSVESLVKQLRAFQGSKWQHDKSRFQRLSRALMQLSEAYLESGDRRDLYSIQLQLRSTLKQAEDLDSMEEYKTLQLALGQVQSLLNCTDCTVGS